MEVMPTDVAFTVTHRFAQPPRVVWDELIDWKGHEQWVPMTRVVLGPEPQDEVGATFMAFTGAWKLGLEDNMRVTVLDWDDDAQTGRCEVEKLGPVLTGTAGFTVEPDGAGTRVEWIEDVTAKYAPGFTAGVAGKAGAAGFSRAMKKLAKLLDSR